MKIVYDEDTQKQIDFYENRKAEIYEEEMKKLDTATAQAEYYRTLQVCPHYNPLIYNQEYHAINNKLFNIYALSVPKFLVTLEEYERLRGTNG